MDILDHEEYEQTLKDFNDDSNDETKLMVMEILRSELATKAPPKPTFRPNHYKCLDCGDEIYSKWPGHWVACKCGKTFVDQDEYIVRMGGRPVQLNIRDPKRIQPLLDRLQEMWVAMPDLRLGQLLQNALGSDFYYTEDEEFINQIELFYKPMIYEQINIETVSGNGKTPSGTRIRDNSTKE